MRNIFPLLCVCVFIVGMGKPPPYNNLSASNKIMKYSRSSKCGTKGWVIENKGKAPSGYIQGMALLYAKNYCELKSGKNSPVQFMASNIGNKLKDALAIFKLPSKTPVERLRSIYTLGLGLGMYESDARTAEGIDKAKGQTCDKYQCWNPNQRRDILEKLGNEAEAGIFQTSYNSIKYHKSMGEVYGYYKSNKHLCMLKEFNKGRTNLTTIEYGVGEGRQFQLFTKYCPAFAAEYAMLVMRLHRGHYYFTSRKRYGRGLYRKECAEMLKRIESLSGC